MTHRPYFFFTVDVEEWFTSAKILSIANTSSVQASSDLEECMQWLIRFLGEEKIYGTFFFIQDIADRHPGLVNALIKEGHEVALHGVTHDDLRTLTPQKIDEMLKTARAFFQKKFNLSLKGYRAPYFSITEKVLPLLKKHDFAYDSSVVPSLRIPGWYGEFGAPQTPYHIGNGLTIRDNQSSFLEFPMSVHPRWRIPGLGGYYFRNLGYHYARHIASQCLKNLNYAIFYLHPWELSISIPRVRGVPFYMHRRTGVWTRKALRALIQSIRHTFNPLSPTLFDYYQSNIS